LSHYQRAEEKRFLVKAEQKSWSFYSIYISSKNKRAFVFSEYLGFTFFILQNKLFENVIWNIV